MTALPLFNAYGLAPKLTVGTGVSWQIQTDPNTHAQVCCDEDDSDDDGLDQLFRGITPEELQEPLDLLWHPTGPRLTLLTHVAGRWRAISLHAPWTLIRALTAIHRFYHTQVPGPAAIADVSDAYLYMDGDKLAAITAGDWPCGGLEYGELISPGAYFEGFRELGPGIVCVCHGIY